MGKMSNVQRLFAILNILREQTNPEHRMDAKEIAAEMERRFDAAIDPRSVRHAIEEMIACGCPIDDSKKYCYKGNLTDGEASYLRNAVRFGTGFTQPDREELYEKLCGLTGCREKIDAHTCNKPGNPQFAETLGIIERAMRDGFQVAFHYGYYDVDGELRLIMRGRNPKIYNASPHGVIVVNGRYYLIASVNKHPEPSHYRIDRIIKIRRRKAKIRPLPQPIDLDVYASEHSSMFTGEVKEFRIRINRKKLNDIYDWFGTSVRFENTTDETTDALVRSDDASMNFWISRYKNAKLIGVNKQE